MKVIEEGAAAGDPEMHYRLAQVWFYGADDPQAESYGLEELKLAAEGGCVDAMLDLADRYSGIAGDERDDALAFHWIRKAAEYNPALLVRVGDCYERGIGTEKNIAAAEACYKAAADSGMNIGRYKLAMLYMYTPDESDKKSYSEWRAFELFSTAADSGLAPAQFETALCYLEGTGTEVNEEQGFRYMSMAAENGMKEAQYNLGSCYYLGRGTEIDYAKALEMYKKAADNGVVEAMRSVGHMYHEGKGTEKDDVKGFEYIKKAAEAGDTDSIGQLGLWYFQGIGTDIDYEKAAEWYEIGSRAGDTTCMAALGSLYMLNKIPGSPDKAIELFDKAAEQDDAIAMYTLGFCYEQGYGVPRDLEKALEMYRKALELHPEYRVIENDIMRLEQKLYK